MNQPVLCSDYHYLPNIVTITKLKRLNIDVNRKYLLSSSLYELFQLAEYHFKFFNNTWFYHLPSPIVTPLPNNHIIRFFNDSPFRRKLLHYQNLLNNPYLQHLEFYTDGSALDIGKSTCSMAFSCIQTSIDAPRFNITAKIDNWPSSSRAELAAIILTILICPIGITVNIFTDSQATIDAFHNFQQLPFPFTSRQWSKICSNSNLWVTL